MPENPAAERRHQNRCAGCQQIDDHPKHAFGVVVGQPLPMPWHMDCHVLVTGCDTCADQLARCGTSTANDGVRGEELTRRLVALRPRHTPED